MPDSDDKTPTESNEANDAYGGVLLRPYATPPMEAELPATMEESAEAWMKRMGD